MRAEVGKRNKNEKGKVLAERKGTG